MASGNTGKRRPYTRNYLVFIDTNIFLDFYRVSQPTGLSLLTHLSTPSVKNKIITTEQVEMEFKKNRQTEILRSLDNFKTPGDIPIPLFLQEAKSATTLTNRIRGLKKRVEDFRAKFLNILNSPTSDPVYRRAEAIFKNYTPLNLSRHNKTVLRRRGEIWRRARKRSMLGYPPRKERDRSIGDAINWEWIVDCAKQTEKHVIIVSRDSDYGDQERGLINDWLKEEFREQTSPGRLIELTPHLARALKTIGVAVTKKEETEEKKLTAAESRPASPGTFQALTELVGFLDRFGQASKLPGFAEFVDSSQEALKQIAESTRPMQERIATFSSSKVPVVPPPNPARSPDK